MSNPDPNTVPDAPDLGNEIRKAKGLPPRPRLTQMEEAYETFLARVKANGGKLVPITDDEDDVPAPPSLADALRERGQR